MVFRLAGLFVALWIAAGCATYTPVRPASVSAGQQVRITLDEAAAPQVLEFLAERPGRVLEGTVAERVGDGMLVEIPTLIRERGMQSEVYRQQVRVREEEIASVELRTVSRSRTAVGIALGSALVVGAVAAIYSGIVGGSGDGLPEPPVTQGWPGW